jgi:hypothetical protein
MLNNLTNFFNLIANGLIKKTVAPTDMIALGTKNPKFGGGYRPTGITMADFLTQIPGSTGPQGPQGPAGPQGVAGPVGPAGLNWQGAWSAAGTYVVDDAVGYGGASWFCINPVGPSATTPDTDPTNWALLASQGSPGVAGPQGIAGPNAIVVGYTTVTSGITDRVFFQSGTVPSQDSRFRYITSRGSLISTGKFANVNNTALGDYALSATTSGLYNTATGYQALRNLSTGTSNVAIGHTAGAGVTSGNGNVAIGHNTMGSAPSNASGITAVGHQTLINGPEGCTAVGSAVMSFSSGTFNTAVGQEAASQLTTGSFNTFIGPYAGFGTYTGNNNIMIGMSAGYVGNYDSTCIIGDDVASGNNQMVIGSAGNNFGTIATEVNTSTKVWNVTINGTPCKILLA